MSEWQKGDKVIVTARATVDRDGDFEFTEGQWIGVRSASILSVEREPDVESAAFGTVIRATVDLGDPDRHGDPVGGVVLVRVDGGVETWPWLSERPIDGRSGFTWPQLSHVEVLFDPSAVTS